MIRNRSLNFVAYVGCILLAASCQSSRTTGSTIPPAPSGPIQTASNDGSVVPAGAVLAIQTDEPIDTETAGEVYSAEVSREVISKDYDVVIPRGSSAELVVVRADRGGTTGTPEIVLALQSLTVNGRKYTVDSAGNVQTGDEGLGRNKRTGRMVGGGAILGTVIGAIAGGAKGAAIGATAGAASGAAVQVLTRGERVQVPAETVLSFQIQRPIELVG